MRIVARILLIILAVAVGGVFIFSAYTKLDDLQQFEYTMVDHLHMPWLLATIAARCFVALEGALGLLMAAQLFGSRKWILKFAFWLLIAFSIYLIYLWATVGNNVNCGCFGTAVYMNASSSLLKNGILLAAVGILIRFHSGIKLKWFNIIGVALPVAAIVTIFIIYPLPPQKAEWLNKKKYSLDLSDVYATTNAKVPDTDLTKGKHIIAFLSATCPHCQKAAYKMHVMKMNNAALPFYMVIAGKKELSEFWKMSEAQNLPYSRLEKDPFLKITKGSFPVILWVDNDTVVATSSYITLNQGEIEQWMNGRIK